jgi:hypothetical protein
MIGLSVLHMWRVGHEGALVQVSLQAFQSSPVNYNPTSAQQTSTIREWYKKPICDLSTKALSPPLPLWSVPPAKVQASIFITVTMRSKATTDNNTWIVKMFHSWKNRRAYVYLFGFATLRGNKQEWLLGEGVSIIHESCYNHKDVRKKHHLS